jgi:hypothetical protein
MGTLATSVFGLWLFVASKKGDDTSSVSNKVGNIVCLALASKDIEGKALH